MNHEQFAALLGFAFVAVWIASGFEGAVLCLLGAVAFWALSSFSRGELDLNRVNERLQRDRWQQR